MTIEAKIICDSMSPEGIRLTTFQLRYPRFIHAELMTHRVFSRNASSSRAIPVTRMIEDLRRDPAMPIYWGSNKPGMQAGEQLDEVGIRLAKDSWIAAMDQAIFHAEGLIKLGLHKQIANRILEPWAHINVVVTATDWDNFYALRRHPAAQPEIKALADLMYAAHEEGPLPVSLGEDDWHLPYIDLDARLKLSSVFGEEEALNMAIKVSVARCARVSYLTHDGRETTVSEDLALANRLLGSVPLHASPAEHQATPDTFHHKFNFGEGRWDRPELHGNLRGWRQYRKTLENECVSG